MPWKLRKVAAINFGVFGLNRKRLEITALESFAVSVKSKDPSNRSKEKHTRCMRGSYKTKMLRQHR